MITIILVKPRNPNNIGASARAMANFGLSDLRIAGAHIPNLEEAQAAVGAEDLLKKAKIFDNLQDALADCNFAFAATSLKNRNTQKEIVSLPNINNHIKRGKIAVVFGSEKTGLSVKDIELCDAVLNIPTTTKQPSVNLAQAVNLVCYETAKTKNFKTLKQQKTNLPSFKDIDLLTADILELFDRKEFKKELTKTDRELLIKNILKSSSLSKKQLFIIKKFLNLLK
ncbi:tRNA/rRNA methyltransferase [Elusimicrobium minutum Pei191]|uniref:tRNA/rRNA methyltransferase n=1 Tax=Elusimicrobium minutum (strain Pei191) TaxID=445932 RepID=B2KEG9_ELUMP|nr:TrmH family RNA methyltransferase [Elusimicrobium minutum]ACC98915.1 tRNA/rRNA methyltransferase [Elusimicrobium minutum Pei191]